MNWLKRALASSSLLALCCCGGGGSSSAGGSVVPVVQATPTGPATLSISPDQKLRMERLSSVFENNTIVFQYGYAENINDGRGYTCGRVGFTTGTGDWYQVVKAYTALRPSNPLAQYLPRLAQLAAGPTPTADTTGLDGMVAATATAGSDPLMQQTQDAFVDSLIYNPSLQVAGNLGIRSALGMAVMYDAILTHGQGPDPDSVDAIIAHATTVAHGTPATGVSEATWLSAFIAALRQDMLHPANAATAMAWAAAVGRLDVYAQQLVNGNWALAGPVDTLGYGVSVP